MAADKRRQAANTSKQEPSTQPSTEKARSSAASRDSQPVEAAEASEPQMDAPAHIAQFITLAISAWIVVDGLHCFWHGDFMTLDGMPGGPLGFWENAVEGVGLAARAPITKYLFVLIGSVRLLAAVRFGLGYSGSWRMMQYAAILGLYYMPQHEVTQLVMLFLSKYRP